MEMTEEQTKWYDKKKLALLLYIFLWPVGLRIVEIECLLQRLKIGGTLLAASY